MKYSMKCSCGDTMDMEGVDRADAVAKFKAMMTQETIDKHMADKHPGNSMTMADCHAMIEKEVMPMM